MIQSTNRDRLLPPYVNLPSEWIAEVAAGVHFAEESETLCLQKYCMFQLAKFITSSLCFLLLLYVCSASFALALSLVVC